MYEYDALGNRTQKTTEEGTYTYAYNSNNQLTSLTYLQTGDSSGDAVTTTYSYDGSGNLTQETKGDIEKNYTYNSRNLLTQYSDGTHTVLYEYDGWGNRVSKIVNGERIKYVNNSVSGLTQVLLETDAKDSILREYAYDVEGRTRHNMYYLCGTDICFYPRYYAYDAPGRSVQGLFDYFKKRVSSREYDAFGNLTDVTGYDEIVTTSDYSAFNPFGYGYC